MVGNFNRISFENCIDEWNGHLEIFSRPEVIGNSRQCWFLRIDQYFTDNSQSLGAPVDISDQSSVEFRYLSWKSDRESLILTVKSLKKQIGIKM